MKMFQHTAARRRLEENLRRLGGAIVSTHSRPKAAGANSLYKQQSNFVSTHSRPKAADIVCPFVHGLFRFQHTAARRRLLNTVMKSKPCTGFNTQPPEGGCLFIRHTHSLSKCFNTQPPEGGWGDDKRGWRIYLVSTHSRPKAAVEE